jgi:hypothetical protein
MGAPFLHFMRLHVTPRHGQESVIPLITMMNCTLLLICAQRFDSEAYFISEG